MIINKDRIQELAAHTLYKDTKLICQWATGVGKSGVVLKFLRASPDMDCLILVPEQNNITNWEAEFGKFGIPRDKVTIACYASFHKYKDTVWDLLVFDEAPHIDTEKRRAICHAVKGSYILALGAVIDQEEREALEEAYGTFTKSVISLDDAIRLGLLPPPTVNVCHIQLNDKTREHWYRGRACTEKEMYDILQNKVDSSVNAYNLKPTKYSKQLMLKAGSERKRFLGNIKESVVRNICRILENQNKRYICFCASIKQAENLGGASHAFTSKSSASMKHLERFNTHEIDSLFVVGKCIEGQNLVDIEDGIITQLGGTSRITVQEIGRVMRSKNPTIWIPVFDDTKDDSFLYTLTSNIPANYIKHYNF